MHAVDFGNPYLSQVAWVSLQEQLISNCEDARKYIANIREEVHKIIFL